MAYSDEADSNSRSRKSSAKCPRCGESMKRYPTNNGHAELRCSRCSIKIEQTETEVIDNE